MADGHRMTGRTPVIAVALAVLAVITVGIATIVVVTRASPARAIAAQPEKPAPALPVSQKVLATDVLRLDREALDSATTATGARGVKVIDAELRGLLSLEASDVITGVSGRPTHRQFDVYDALLGASMMNATALFIELERDGKPLLLRWELDGDLRSARTASRSRSRSSSIGGLSTPNPYALPFTPTPVAPDPLLDTIKRLDEFHYELPRSTIDSLLANPSALARAARVVPAMRNGQPDGFKIYAVRPSSVYAALGLANGDTIQSVNGYPLTTPDKALEVYTKVRDANELVLELMRRGKPQVLKITVTR